MEAGQKLWNGALVICEKNGVVLAVTKYYSTFITWRWDGKDTRTLWAGHYFASVAHAAADFERRVLANGG